MKRAIILLAITLFSTITFAQERQKHEEIKALKVAFITTNLNLTVSEAEKFWPIYNAHEERVHALRKKEHENRMNIDIENISEAEAETLIKKFKDSNTEKINTYNTFISDLQKVISAKKIVLLKKTEDDFKRKIFEEYKMRRRRGPKEDDRP